MQQRFVLRCGSRPAVALSLALPFAAAALAGADDAPTYDLTVGGIQEIVKFGAVGDVAAYAIGCQPCNLGATPLAWIANTNQHPIFTMNMYRLKDGRFEQVGMSWAKHEFCALQMNLCSTCNPAGTCTPLGSGCSTADTGSSNGYQPGLGPRSQINPVTGAFPFPFSAPAAPPTIGRRLQVHGADLDPSLNRGALYFVEGLMVHPADAAAGSGANNASHRRAIVGAFVNGAWNLSLTGAVEAEAPAIQAWKDNGLGVGLPDPDVTITNVDVGGDGRFVLGSKVTDQGDGTWTYEYAVFNLNSDRAAGSFRVPTSDAVIVADVGFHDVDYHSGESYDGADWEAVIGGCAVTWSTVDFATNPNANAVRWGTLYNYRLTATTPPTERLATIGLFKPASVSSPQTSVDVLVKAPSIGTSLCGNGTCDPGEDGTTCPCDCPVMCVADFNGDHAIDGADLTILLGAWGNPGATDLNADGTTNASDLATLLGTWGTCS